MFYAQFVLSKKGPLAKIWLAAHWEKKLTKSHVYETNINQAVESILEPKVKMALRTTGHLLLGIVRIYSRKAKYLLADCNEAFIKIKMAFRPGVVDLPEEGREANVNAITLPEVFHDFDSALPDFSELEYQQQLTANQSRREDITMTEDIPLIGPAFTQDDEFGDAGFGDSIEFGRDAGDSNLRDTRPSDITLKPDKSGGIDIDAPADDDFGGQLDENILNLDMEDIFGAGLGNDTVVENMDIGSVGDVGGTEDSSSEAGDGDVRQETPAPAPSTSSGPTAGFKPGDTTLITADEEAFALEPLETVLVQGFERHKAKRKRKLIVDEMKSIPGEDMKNQLSDPGDTISQLDIAPPTKKLMQWKETGGVDKLFSLPAMRIVSKQLLKLYSVNLVTRSRDEDGGSVDDQMIHLDGPDANEQDLAQQYLTSAPPVAPVGGDHLGGALEAIPEESSGAGDPSGSTSLCRAEVLSVANDIALPSMPGDDFNGQPPPSVSPSEPFSPWVPPEEPPTPFNDLEAPPENIMQEEPQEEELNDEEATEEVVEKRWNKRTQQVLKTMKKQLRHPQDNISFMEFTRGVNRKQAAQKFYTLLVLKKWKEIEVDQPSPFGDIYVTLPAA